LTPDSSATLLNSVPESAFPQIAISDFRLLRFLPFPSENVCDLWSRFLERFSLFWFQIFRFEDLKASGRFDRIADCSLGKSENVFSIGGRSCPGAIQPNLRLSALSDLRETLRQVGKVFAGPRFFTTPSARVCAVVFSGSRRHRAPILLRCILP
jgi:hypothetical protein